MNIKYCINVPLASEVASKLYKESTLAERRPSDDLEVMNKMLENANLTVTAWHDSELVGISRTLTDFCFVAYLADLAVHKDYQGNGIGKQLIRQTQQELESTCKIVLLAAPKAEEYYPRIGFAPHNSAWVISASETIE